MIGPLQSRGGTKKKLYLELVLAQICLETFLTDIVSSQEKLTKKKKIILIKCKVMILYIEIYNSKLGGGEKFCYTDHFFYNYRHVQS